jgi:GNAT superfamily N-acetyltransferase
MQIRRLEEGEKIESFNCGDSDLDDFIINDAQYYRASLLAVSYIMEDNNMPIAYFSLSNDKISVQDFESNRKFNKFKGIFHSKKRIRGYPAVKIGRFAISEIAQKQGIGSQLLDFIKAYFLINNKTGCRFITVDAYRSAIPFYEKNGFLHLQSVDDNKPTKLMYFDLNNYKGYLKINI